MHITLESDYAIRIVDCLARSGRRLGAQVIAEKTNVTLRFSLKILCKLVANGIARSYKGAQGGYEIAKPLDEISIGDIIEAIEGPYMLSRCLKDDHVCVMQDSGPCSYHYLFRHISDQVRARLKGITLAAIIKG